MVGPRSAGVEHHLASLGLALEQLRADADRLEHWGEYLGRALDTGARLLVAGNGGSAAHAQHLSSELTGRFLAERKPLAAIALHVDTSAFSAIANDYGFDQVYARQVSAHGRPDDVFVGISTSGASTNVLAAVTVARRLGLRTWALTGPAPNPLAASVDDAFSVDASSTAVVQDIHQVAIHLICRAVDAAVDAGASRGVAEVGS
jgi:D-sedoheptulose 7-phosphate isomerase